MTSKVYRFSARVEGGRLKIALPALRKLHDAVGHWRRCPVTVTIEKAYATRSLEANAYYWSVILAHLAEYSGQDILDLHEYCKKRFNPHVVVICDPNGVIEGEEVIGQTTTKLNRLTFYEYVEAIRLWMREDLGVQTPDPDPQWRAQTRDKVTA